MPVVLVAVLELLPLGLLVTGSVAGIVLGTAVAGVPRIRRLLAPTAALLGAVLLLPSGRTTGWVVVAVAVPALAAVVPALSDEVPEIASSGLAAVAALVGALALGPAAAAKIEVPRAEVVVAFAALAGLAALVADRHLRPALIIALGAWTGFGLFLCNPDPEGAALVGALLATAASVVALVDHLAGRDRRRRLRTTVIGSAVPMVLLLVWVGVEGAARREESIISGYACLGVLLVLPVAAAVALLVPREHDAGPRLLPGALAIAVQAPLVVVVARLGGVRTTAERALLVGAVALALATAVLALALGQDHRADDEVNGVPTSPT